MTLINLIFIIIAVQTVRALDNGLVSKPPMGWLAWARYTCNTDCINYPEADLLAKGKYIACSTGEEANVEGLRNFFNLTEYLKYGYEYINIDDCWSELSRDNITKELAADKKRFPNGIRKLSDYVHSKGLKMGIYSDIGTKTCAGYPGHQDNDEKGKFYYNTDAQTFARWNIDYLKVDGCNADTALYDITYPSLGQALNKSGRPIVFSCSWPAYLIDQQEKKKLDFNKIAVACNVWRNYDDIMFSWASVTSIIDFYAKHQDEYVEIHGPGQWFDPDMIIVGNNGLSIEQMKSQFGIWAIWSAPLFISADLSKIRAEEKEILTNQFVIDVNQDEEGIFGRRVYKQRNFEIWLKPLSPVRIKNLDHYQYAIVYFNREVLGSAKYFSRSVKDLIVGYGKSSKIYSPSQDLIRNSEQPIVYKVIDLFDNGADIDRVRINHNLTLKVDVAGAVRMVKLIPQSDF